jgi:hypothetical protein
MAVEERDDTNGGGPAAAAAARPGTAADRAGDGSGRPPGPPVRERGNHPVTARAAALGLAGAVVVSAIQVVFKARPQTVILRSTAF